MGYIMTNHEFVSRAKSIHKLNTIYATGTFGQEITNNVILAKRNQYPNKYPANKISELRALVGKKYYGFDCLGFIKSILWGFPNVRYLSNDVADFTEQGMMTLCSEVSTDWSKIPSGAVLYMAGHVGIYLGNGEVAECTTKWTGNVLISKLGNISKYKTGKYRIWLKWGKIKYIDYTEVKINTVDTPKTSSSNLNLASGQPISLINYVYASGKAMPSWTKNVKLYYRGKSTDGNAIISTLKSGAITGTVKYTNIVEANNVDNASLSTTTVRAKEGYWQIAERVLKNGTRYPEIQKLNNNKALFVGDIVVVPSK